MKNKKYNYFYKITNNANEHFYYGVHSTDDLNDGYMGSGTRLKLAYEKYGIENFKKEILKFFNTLDEAYEYESMIVTEKLIHDDNCYNLVKGGKTGFDENCIPAKDADGKILMVKPDDERFKTGEITNASKGMIVVKDKNGNIFRVKTTNPKYISGELIPFCKNRKLSEEHKKHLSESKRKIRKEKKIR